MISNSIFNVRPMRFHPEFTVIDTVRTSTQFCYSILGTVGVVQFHVNQNAEESHQQEAAPTQSQSQALYQERITAETTRSEQTNDF